MSRLRMMNMPANSARRFKHGTLSVLHVAQPVDGGVAAYILRLSRTQRTQGRQVTVASPPGPLAVSLRERGVDWVEWRATRSPGPSIAAETRALRRIVDRVRPDIVHLHSSKAGVAGRLRALGPRTIFQPHGWSWDAVEGATALAVRRWERFAAPRSDLLICVSREERERGESAGLVAHWRVIENAVDLDEFSFQSEEDRVRARAQLGLSRAPIAVCVGPLRYQKGQDLLVDAWAHVKVAEPEAKLVLVGDGPEREQVAELAGGMGVVFAGHQEKVVPWLAAADLVVIPSRWDGLSLSLLEAMASGRSVVATDVPGVVRVLGAGGEVVPVGDHSALATALIRRLKDPELTAREGLAARRRAEEAFDWDLLTERMDEAYALVMSSQP
ncbi:MAG TPA: glycosyltransferase [Actinomycetota bacterium]|nr:glycosyltransferase [Actinomycetota bacterium]